MDDNVRFSLNDDSGELRFEEFDIVGCPDCARLATKLRQDRLARSLADVHLAHLEDLLAEEDADRAQAVCKVI